MNTKEMQKILVANGFTYGENAASLALVGYELATRTSKAAPGTIGIQEAWEVAGGNPGIKATREDLLIALRDLDAVADEVPPKSQPTPVAEKTDDYPARLLNESNVSLAWRVDAWHNRNPSKAEPVVVVDDARPIYQLQQVNGAWLDVSEEKYRALKSNFGRIVILAPKPNGYAYLYPYGSDKTIVQFNYGGKMLGLDPIAAVPYYFGEPVDVVTKLPIAAQPGAAKEEQEP